MSKKRDKFRIAGDIGRHYGKLDLDRVGFFDDQPAGPFDKYVKGVATAARSDFKGRQLLAGRPDDFFDKTFKRIFTGEALTSALPEEKKAGGRAMLPPSPSKLHSTPNDWFGCIGKQPDYFSPEVKKPATNDGRNKGTVDGKPPNFKVKPNPLGGPGYVDICLNPYPKHSSEPYDYQDKSNKGGKIGQSTKFLTASASLAYFPPNPYLEPKPGPTYVRPASDGKFKTPSGGQSGHFYVPFPKEPGGLHAGCFSKFPEYTSEPYQDEKRQVHLSTTGQSKFLGGGPNSRSKYTSSVINRVTEVSCNIKNYREYEERVYPLPH